MALTFPLGLDEFFSSLCPISTTFVLGEAVEASETGGGEVLRSDYGPRLWRGTVTLKPLKPIMSEDVMALIRVLQDARASFRVTPHHYPQARAMSSVAVPAGKIHSLGGDNRSLRVKDLTAGFVISRGDFLSFTYLSPIRRAFHQAVESVTANGSGLTGFFEVIPAVRPGAAADADVYLKTAYLKAVMVPNSLQMFELPRKGWVSGASFAWQQTLR